MRTNTKLKIGLAGVMVTPFRGDKEGNFRKDYQALQKMAFDYNFELKTIEQGIYSQDQAINAAQALADWGADFILLQSSSFAAGKFIYPFAETSIRLGLWGVPEGEPKTPPRHRATESFFPAPYSVPSTEPGPHGSECFAVKVFPSPPGRTRNVDKKALKTAKARHQTPCTPSLHL